MYKNPNKNKEQQTANPEKYPQKRFNKKPCRNCGNTFQPRAPSELYCTDECKNFGFWDSYLKRTYGISYSEFLQLKEESGGVCNICGSEGFILNPKSEMKLVIDHCHSTGKIRGLICHNCNRALGLFQDSLDNLYNAIFYLERATTIRKE